VAIVPAESYLYKAGLRAGDKLLRLDGDGVPAWSTFRERVFSAPDRQHHFDYFSARDGRVRSGEFQMRREEFSDPRGQTIRRQYVLPIQHWTPVAPEERVAHPSPLRYALVKAVEETVDVTRLVIVGLVRVAQGRLSLDTLSGPITIYQVAGEEGRKGPDYFIWAMAVISINLGLFNLLPIPVLDGGHLLFLMLEGVLRRKVPLRIRELSHIVGMAILFGLMVLAFKNDIEKRWDTLIGDQTRISG
jgi:regulator of sigma E protease